MLMPVTANPWRNTCDTACCAIRPTVSGTALDTLRKRASRSKSDKRCPEVNSAIGGHDGWAAATVNALVPSRMAMAVDIPVSLLMRSQDGCSNSTIGVDDKYAAASVTTLGVSSNWRPIDDT